MNKRIEKIRPEDMEALTQYHWPGNVRELQNVERSMVLASGAILNCSLLAELHLIGRNPKSEPRTLAEAERGKILAALRETDWVVGGSDGAAAHLGVKRTTLLDKMRRHRISRAA
jgi:formate hydrogenlyase transcriptional activator